MPPKLQAILLLCICFAPTMLVAQDSDSLLARSGKIQSNYIDAVSKKAATTTTALNKQTDKYLARLQRQEAKLQKRLSKIDSLAAHNIFAESAKKYEALQQKASGKAGKY